MKERLLLVLRGLAHRMCIVLILGTICLHTDTPTAYRQNHSLRTHLNLSINARNITSRADIFDWLLERAIPNLQPKLWSNGQLMSLYQQKFASDLEMYRMTPVTVTQKRVKGKTVYSYCCGYAFYDLIFW
ncbi:polycystic kidney disease protein 1-like 2 [Elysia marginata]|uniref:Polycystic kidney disease protein 1-like 2 n=1 Tax=Elysia marginata TaxID=1093978 RepID=A0AAV4HYD3_9GAST|nr:polycystic kidney disease protein 1-like 2 [Elysia marginata]